MSTNLKKSSDELKKAAIQTETKTWTVTQRFSEREVALLDAYADKISESTGVKVKRAWVIRKLIELGQEVLEKEYGIKLKKTGN